MKTESTAVTKKNKTLFAAGLSATSARSRDQKTQFLKSQLLYR